MDDSVLEACLQKFYPDVKRLQIHFSLWRNFAFPGTAEDVEACLRTLPPLVRRCDFVFAVGFVGSLGCGTLEEVRVRKDEAYRRLGGVWRGLTQREGESWVVRRDREGLWGLGTPGGRCEYMAFLPKSMLPESSELKAGE